ncbi:extensin family protein [Aliiroseovarius crassostreae]|uniref:extensin-like domain-containing protein n=1 Tax=Aliiroseovarius crassostreae TaxID=154981 RepID=UPI003C7C07CC
MLILTPGLANADDLDRSPIPVPRPATVPEPAPASQTDAEGKGSGAERSPSERSPVADAATGDEAKTEIEPGSDAQPDSDTSDTPPQWKVTALAEADYTACLADLDALGVSYREGDPITSDDNPDCGILRPLVVDKITTGVAITPAATLRCDAVRSLARWTRDFVLPAARRLEDRGALVAIQNGSGYVCRARNGTSDRKLSQHALGSGFDVMGFTFETGAAIPIEPREADGTMAEAFQDAVRASACLDFTTVLGPGSNAAHENHLHLDVIKRSTGYRICEQGG